MVTPAAKPTRRSVSLNRCRQDYADIGHEHREQAGRLSIACILADEVGASGWLEEGLADPENLNGTRRRVLRPDGARQPYYASTLPA
jgi:hypothetical protein